LLLYCLSEALNIFFVFLLNNYSTLIQNYSNIFSNWTEFSLTLFYLLLFFLLLIGLRYFFLYVCIQMSNKQLFMDSTTALFKSSLKSFAK